MDVRLSPEQRALRDSVAQVVAHLGPSAVGQLDDAERAAKLDAAVAAAGWRELRSPTDGGGPWATGVEVAIVAEGLATGLADTAFVGPTLAAELRRLAGASGAVGAETLLVGADLSAPAVVVEGEPAPDTLAFDAGGATAALALVQAPGGWSLATVAVEGDRAGVDLTRSVVPPAPAATAEPVPGTRLLSDDDLGRVTALGLAATCADLVGVQQGVTDLAVGYAKERRQYGAPIGAFQAVQHLLADAFVTTEGARSIALHAAWAVDALAPAEAVTAGAVAKAYAARAARTACETAIQVHGGIGNTWECLAHVHLRRALVSGDAFGGVEANLARVVHAHLGGGHGLR